MHCAESGAATLSVRSKQLTTSSSTAAGGCVRVKREFIRKDSNLMMKMH